MSSPRTGPGNRTGRAGGPGAAYIGRARDLLAHEAVGAAMDAGPSAATYATAAGRVYDKLNAQFGSLLGTGGVQALFVRSAKLAQVVGEGSTPAALLESAATLSAFLRTLDRAAATRAAEALFATFLSLVATFIGERLTLQALRRAWPASKAPAPTETKK